MTLDIPERVESMVQIRNAMRPVRLATYSENLTTGQRYFMGHICSSGQW